MTITSPGRDNGRLARLSRLPLALLSLVAAGALIPATGRAQRVDPGGPPPVGSGPIQVSGPVRVIDGDTLEASIDGKRVGIGLIGSDAPEGNTACGRDATSQLRTLSRGGLRLEEDPALTFDQKGRRMYYAYGRDGRSIAREQVKDGVARADGRGKDSASLDTAESEARAARRGCVWREGRAADPDAPALASLPLDLPMLAAPPPAPQPLGIAAAPAATTLPGGFVQDVMASGLSSPTALAFLPDGRILIAEKAGLVRVYKNGTILSTPFIDIQDRVNDYWDHGLLGMAPDPSFASNGHVYLLYTYENNDADYSGTKTARLARYTAAGDTASRSSEQVLLGTVVGSSCSDFPAGADCLPSESPSHSIGAIKFAADGTMFVTAGDGAHFNFVDDNALRAQNLDLLSGKLLRVTTGGVGLSSNPFWTGDAGANRSKVWAYGLRNAYRFNLRPGSGVPYLGDVGWGTWEEVDIAPVGANLGWPCYEGGARQSGYESKATCQALYGQGTSAVRMPLVAWEHQDAGGNSVSSAATGGAFYTGAAYPSQYQGAYFYADYAQNWIRSLRVDANDGLVSGSVTSFATAADNPVALEMGPDEHLYYLSISSGQLRRIRYAGDSNSTSCPKGQYRAEYFNNRTLSGTPNFTRCEVSINNDWGGGGPGNGIATDNFSVRWNGTFPFTAGNQTFTATADDGIRVWLNPGQNSSPIIDAWNDQPPTTYQATRSVAAGDHVVKVEYYESGGGAVARLSWLAAANQPPSPTISSPASTLTFKVGDTIGYSGSATDPEDGTISPERLAWTVTIQHCQGSSCHPHTLIPSTSGASGSFTAPDHEEDFFLEIKLTATDSQGLTGTTSVKIDPKTVQLTLITSPSGLQVVYNGRSGPAPLTSKPIVGGTRTISAPSPQGDATFGSWSDGGAREHNVTVGSADATYTATFADTTSPALSAVKAAGISPKQATITWTTHEPADSQAEYGTSTTYGSSSRLDPARVTDHSVKLTGLKPKTTYYYRVKSKDATGNLAVSGQYSFMTK